MMTPKVNNTLISGLQRTLAMRLPGHPPADAADGMFQAWIAAFNALPIAWDDQRDVPRLERAFAVFWGQADKWPTPKMLMDCLPPVPPPPTLEYKKTWTPEEIARNKQRLAGILNELGEKMGKRQRFLMAGRDDDTSS